MKNILKFSHIAFGALFATASFCGSAHADADLARKKNCMSCHSVNAKIIGPAFKQVAEKYAADQQAEEKIKQKILRGSTGAWGAMPMPPNPQVTEPEALALAKWVLMK